MESVGGYFTKAGLVPQHAMFNKSIHVLNVQHVQLAQQQVAARLQHAEQQNELPPNQHQGDVTHGIVGVYVQGYNLMIKSILVKGSRINIYEFVRRFELDTIELETDGMSFTFVIDIYKEYKGDFFFPKVYRKEFYKLQPSFLETTLDESLKYCDEEILVEEQSHDWSNMKYITKSEVVTTVLKKIQALF